MEMVQKSDASHVAPTNRADSRMAGGGALTRGRSPEAEGILMAASPQKLASLMDEAKQGDIGAYAKATVCARQILQEYGDDPKSLLAAFRILREDPMERRCEQTSMTRTFYEDVSMQGMGDGLVVETRFLSPHTQTMRALRSAYEARLAELLEAALVTVGTLKAEAVEKDAQISRLKNPPAGWGLR